MSFLKQIHGNSFEKKLSVLFGMHSEVSSLLLFNLQRMIHVIFLFFLLHAFLTASREEIRAQQVMVGQLKGHQPWQLFHLH
jgi:hypothetical protein